MVCRRVPSAGMTRARSAGKSRVARGFVVIDSMEALFYGLAALAVLGLLLFLALRAAHSIGGPLALGVAIAATLFVLGTAVRDARRRQWGPTSIAVTAAYLMCVLTVIAAQAVAG
jgi:hypothetical protein